MEGRMTQIEGADSGGNLYHKMDDQRDIDAAHVLLELANVFQHFRKNASPSLGRNHDDDQQYIEAAHALLELANVFHHFRKNALPSLRRNHDVVQVLDNRQHANRLGGDRRMDLKGERSHFLLLKANNEERKQKKRKPGDGVPFPQIKKQRNIYIREKKQEQKDNSHGMFGSSLCRKCQRRIEARESDDRYRLCRGCLESKTAKKTLKAKSNVTYMHGPEQFSHGRSQKLVDRPTTVKKKRGLLKENARIVSSIGGKNDDLDPSVKASANDMMVSVKKSEKKKPLSFSIMHLLSAVRTALITPSTDEYEVLSGGHLGEDNGGRNILPSLTIHEIVHHVRLQPGDPRILATKEPLQDLVRGVLKIFSSQTAPLGVRGWKALTAYGKNTKTWSWIGPVPFNLSHDHHNKEEMSPETWDIPHPTLLKLIDCFGNWLKQLQNTLKQIGSLPSPPVLLLKQTDMKERFRHLKTMKNLSTISQSCDEVEAYFRREEALRYSIPDRAFSYTAVDGRKSTVAPLTSYDGKPAFKARDHFMLKRRRPPHFTVLSLVKDAAARLPASIGTKADICTLVRDSQFIMEGISDLQVNQVVSKALDRLRYERDPCIRYDRDIQLWAYLHGERENGEFEDHGPCPRKKSRRVEGMQREGEVHQGH